MNSRDLLPSQSSLHAFAPPRLPFMLSFHLPSAFSSTPDLWLASLREPLSVSFSASAAEPGKYLGHPGHQPTPSIWLALPVFCCIVQLPWLPTIHCDPAASGQQFLPGASGLEIRGTTHPSPNGGGILHPLPKKMIIISWEECHNLDVPLFLLVYSCCGFLCVHTLPRRGKK